MGTNTIHEEWQAQLDAVVGQFADFMESLEDQGFDCAVIAQALTATLATCAIQYEMDEQWLAGVLINYVQKVRPAPVLYSAPAEA